MTTLLKVDGLSKYYRRGAIGFGSLREDLDRGWAKLTKKQSQHLNYQESSQGVWALRDINFSVNEGEVLGIVGANGSGKSTLLKIISRITVPTIGTVSLRGRTGSLLEIGAGFHPELTGRENLYLNGAILGMSRAETKAKLDEIVDFSGISSALDTPVKRYSTGMFVRLAFSIALHLDAEILIVDEVLAVGDLDFQTKCQEKIALAAKSGRTVLIVSHNMKFIETLCSRALLLDKGMLHHDGSVATTIDKYSRIGG